MGRWHLTHAYRHRVDADDADDERDDDDDNGSTTTKLMLSSMSYDDFGLSDAVSDCSQSLSIVGVPMMPSLHLPLSNYYADDDDGGDDDACDDGGDDDDGFVVVVDYHCCMSVVHRYNVCAPVVGPLTNWMDLVNFVAIRRYPSLVNLN